MADHQVTSTDGEKIFGLNTEFHRFGLISAILLIVGVSGGIAVGLGGIESVFSLILIVVPTMTTLSLLLAVAPMKYIIASGVVAIAEITIIIAFLRVEITTVVFLI